MNGYKFLASQKLSIAGSALAVDGTLGRALTLPPYDGGRGRFHRHGKKGAKL